MIDERDTELYSELCDIICRDLLNISDDDPYQHTSDVSRRIARKILERLRDNDLLNR